MHAEVQREGLEAVFAQDAPRLARALAAGFELEEFRHVEASARFSPSLRVSSPMSPFLRTINLGWYSGWTLLLNAFPEHAHREGATGFPILWETALYKAQRAMLQDLHRFGVDPQVRDERHRSSMHVLFEGVRENALDRPAPNELIRCLKWLAGKGVDVFEPYPGEYSLEDLYNTKEGQTLWTYAVAQESWPVASMLLPARWADVVRSPRWRPILMDLRARCAAGKFRVNLPYELWGRFLSRFMEPWMDETGDLLTDAMGIRWVIQMPPPQRQKVWARWSRVDAQGRMAWHRVAQLAALDCVAKALQLAHDDGVPLAQIWAQAEPFGERPMDAWAYALDGAKIPLRAPEWQVYRHLWKSLAPEAVHLVDSIHDPSVNAMMEGVAKTWARAVPRHPSVYESKAVGEQLSAFRAGVTLEQALTSPKLLLDVPKPDDPAGQSPV